MTEFLVFVLIVAFVFEWVRGRQSREVLQDLQSRLLNLENRQESLESIVLDDRKTRSAAASQTATTLAPADVPPSTLVGVPPSSVAAVPSPAPPRVVPAVTPPVSPAPPPPPPAAAPPPVAAPPLAAAAAPVPSAATVATAGPSVAHARRRPPPEASASDDSLESRIGGRWLLYIGVAAIVIGASYFVKHAIDNAWITPAMRVVFGALGGLVLVAAGTRFVRAGYGFYGQILTGGGVAVLYVCTYAAFNFYHLIGQPLALALMLGITAGASVLADRQQSQGLALMAVGGGFVTPFLISDRSGNEVALFGYDAVLIAGTMYLAHRRAWPMLNLVSSVLTTATVVAWAATSWTPAHRWSTQVFLTLFGGMFLYIQHENRRNASGLARIVGFVLGAVVALAHLGSLANLGGHPSAYVGYLIALTAAGLAGFSRMTNDRPALRLVLWFAVILPFIGRAEVLAQRLGTGGVAIGLAALYLMHLAVQLRAIRERDDLEGAEIALIHAAGLGTFTGAYVALFDVRLAAIPVVALLLAACAFSAAAILRRIRVDAALHFIALTATLVAMAAAERFDGAWVIMAWTTEGAALLWLGLRARRTWVRLAGGVLLILGIAQLLQLLNLPAPLGQLTFFNARALTGVYVAGLLLALGWIHTRLDVTSAGVEVASGCLLAATLLVTTVFTTEINAYWTARGEGLSDRLLIELARTMSLVAGWMTAGSALVVTALQRRSTWLRAAGALVIAIALGPLFLMLLGQAPALPAVPVGYTVVANARVLAALFTIGVLSYLAWLHDRHAATLMSGGRIEVDVLLVVAHVVAATIATSEIGVYWRLGEPATPVLNAMSSYAMCAAAIATVGCSLVFIGLRRAASELRLFGAVILTIGAGWMAAVLLAPASEGYRTVLNARAFSGLMVVVLLGLLAMLIRSSRTLHAHGTREAEMGAAVIGASVLAWLLLTSEINAFWQVRDAGRTGYLARQMTLSIVWATYALSLVAAGMWRDYAPVRYLAIGLLGLTIGKVFFVDLSELDQIYRIASAIGLGILLTVTSFLYQRRRKVTT